MSTEIVVQNGNHISSFPEAGEWAIMQKQAEIFIESGYMPKGVDTAAKVIVIMLKGRELNIPPMLALNQIDIINGTPAMRSQLMLTLIWKTFPSTKIEYVQSDDKACIIKATRPGQKESKFTWTMEMAIKAKLLNKPGNTWKDFPHDMLRNRCISQMARAIFPDAIAGMYDPEELEHLDDAEMQATGNVVAQAGNGAALTKDMSDLPPTKDELGKMFSLQKQKQIDDLTFGEYMRNDLNCKTHKDITREKYDQAMHWINNPPTIDAKAKPAPAMQ